MTRLVAALPLLLSGCLQVNLSGVSSDAPPPPARATLEAVARRAYAAYADALATADGSRLTLAFTGQVLEQVRTRAADLRLLRESEQLEPIAETLVHWSAEPGSGEAVLAVRGRERLVIAGRPTAWDSYVGQWLFAIAWRGGWRVSQATDLPPQDWWPA